MTDSLTRTKKKNKKKSQLNWKKVLVSLIIVFIIICLGMGCFFAWSVYKETEDFYFREKQVKFMMPTVN